MTVPLDRLAAHERYWRRHGVRRASSQLQPATTRSGWPMLDRVLPGGGYPAGAVTEMLCAQTGIGEVSFLLECLRQRLDADPRRQAAFVSPPHAVSAPALISAGIDLTRLPVLTCARDAERVWAIEQMAQTGLFTAFVLWSETLDTTHLRRLQLIAEQASCPIFVYRSLQQARQRSPAALRLAITQVDGAQQLEVLKCRGPAGARVTGFHTGRDRPWIRPAPRSSTRTTACNDSEDADVARTAFPPLGTR